MTHDPDLNRDPPGVRNPPPRTSRGGTWTWAVIGAAIVLGLVVWSLMSGGPGVDQSTTSSMPPSATDTAPVVQPTTPAAPATVPTNPPAGSSQP
ncbi:hypothetical protein DFR48_107139 [Ciceribacter lividus]|uniref:Uncharacterized protein n=1 Tax=Ciceribacter lividus TaxID=1197950 RepID=A0A6I7HLX6_9HYPH|nr:hypothetical protein [Ciceribacter lividus]RCW23269.1 hypothetical protein DFR48_107139 [Ciceribacter lividus]